MSVPLFRILQARFSNGGVSALFAAPRKPRHPLSRLAFGLFGLVLLALLLVVGVFVGAAMLLGGLALRTLGKRGRAEPARRPVVEGQYQVVKGGHALLR